MDHQSLQNILSIYRLLKEGGGAITPIKLISRWINGSGKDSEILKVASYIIEQAFMAKSVIDNSQLVPEAKSGVINSIDQITKAFSLSNLNSNINTSVTNVDGSISNLVILLSAMQIPTDIYIPSEVETLLSDIQNMIKMFGDVELDPAVRDVGLRHMAILQTLLKNISLFGVEAALTTYFELVTKLRRADSGATDAAQKKLDPLFDQIKGWAPSLSEIDKSLNDRSRLVTDLAQPMSLLEYAPSR